MFDEIILLAFHTHTYIYIYFLLLLKNIHLYYLDNNERLYERRYVIINYFKTYFKLNSLENNIRQRSMILIYMNKAILCSMLL